MCSLAYLELHVDFRCWLLFKTEFNVCGGLRSYLCPLQSNDELIDDLSPIVRFI